MTHVLLVVQLLCTCCWCLIPLSPTWAQCRWPTSPPLVTSLVAALSTISHLVAQLKTRVCWVNAVTLQAKFCSKGHP